MPEANAALGIDPRRSSIRSPVPHRLAHARHERLGHQERTAVEGEHAGKAAHQRMFRLLIVEQHASEPAEERTAHCENEKRESNVDQSHVR